MTAVTLDALLEAPFRLRESAVKVPLREGTYQAGKEHEVYFQDGQTLADVAHLYAVLKEDADTGSPNLENELVREMLHSLQLGQTLSNDQLGKLFELLAKYADEIAAFRDDPDSAQDILAVPDGGTARIVR